MAKVSSLYSGFISGKRLTPIKFASNNPALDTTNVEVRAQAALRAHMTKGTKPARRIDGPTRRISHTGVAGSRVAGAARIRGGVV